MSLGDLLVVLTATNTNQRATSFIQFLQFSTEPDETQLITQTFNFFLPRIGRALSQGRGTYFASLAFSQLAPLASAPIVSRLYSPDSFGIYGLFYAIVAVLASISSLALHNAVVLRKDGEPVLNAVALSLATTTIFSLGLFAVVILVGEKLVETFFTLELAQIINFLPLSVFLAGTSMCLTSWAVRTNSFALLARNKLVLALATAILQIAIGCCKIGAIGFVLANILGIGLSILLLLVPFVRCYRHLAFRPSIAAVSECLKESKMLVFWMAPANLVSSISTFIPEMMIGRFFGVALLGQFVLANRMLNFPIAFMSGGFQDIFRQQAVSEFNAHGMCRKTFTRFFGFLLGVSVLVIIPIVFAVPYFFPIIFGTQWTDAGTLVQSIAFLTIVRFIAAPLSYVWIIRGRQHLDFFWQLGFLGLSLGSLFVQPILMPQTSLYLTLSIYSLVVGAWYLLSLAVSYKLSR